MLHLNINPTNGQTDLSPVKSFLLLTVDVILQRADALLVQTHHGWEEDGLGTGIHLHLLVKPLPSENGRLLRDVTEI